MEKRGQSALEYLMTYGWALIVIAIVIGVLIYVTSTGTGGVTCQSLSSGIVVKEWAVVGGASGVGLTLQNATGGAIDPTASGGAGSFTGTGTISDTNVLKNATFTVTAIGAPVAGTTFSDGYVDLNYVTAGELSASARVQCAGTV